MYKKGIAGLLCLLLLSACGGAGDVSQPPAQAAWPELEETPWQAVTTDAGAFGLEEEEAIAALDRLDTLPLDQLAALALTGDGAVAEGTQEELRSRFLQAPHTVLTYLALMGETGEAEWLCRLLAWADAAWYADSQEFAQTLAACREDYPAGPAAWLLDILEQEHAAALEQNA